MKRVVVTGATGFVGRHIVEPLRTRGYEVHGVGREPPDDADFTFHRVDLLDRAATSRIIGDIAASHLIHLAWSVPPGKYWQAASNLDWVAGSLGLVRSFVEAGGVRAVVAGTCAEYDWTDAAILTEGHTPYAPPSLYGASKDALRRLLTSYAGTTPLSLAWGHVFFLYGSGEPPGRLVSDAISSLLRGRRFATSPGSQRRDFMHVRDVAGAFAAILDSGVGGAVNVASGSAVPVGDILREIARQIGRADLVDFGALPLSKTEPAIIEADVRRLHGQVGFRPEIGLERGLADTIAWWTARQDQMSP